MIFVDTSGWYAAFIAKDPLHSAVNAIRLSSRETLVTTDYVIDETLTLFKARGNREAAYRIGGELWSGMLATVVRITMEDLGAAWQVFNAYRDKDWSFTDCTSYVVMKRLSIAKALAADDHFRQFGFLTVLP